MFQEYSVFINVCFPSILISITIEKEMLRKLFKMVDSEFNLVATNMAIYKAATIIDSDETTSLLPISSDY